MDNTRYPALSFISNIINIFGYINLIISFGAAIMAIGKMEPWFLLVFLGALLSALICFATAEGIIVLVDIEYNTRNITSLNSTNALKNNEEKVIYSVGEYVRLFKEGNLNTPTILATFEHIHPNVLLKTISKTSLVAARYEFNIDSKTYIFFKDQLVDYLNKKLSQI